MLELWAKVLEKDGSAQHFVITLSLKCFKLFDFGPSLLNGKSYIVIKMCIKLFVLFYLKKLSDCINHLHVVHSEAVISLHLDISFALGFFLPHCQKQVRLFIHKHIVFAKQS